MNSRIAGGVDGIQYLRAIAALMVVAHHARHYFPHVTHWTNFGSRGVDIFFVISGFIMAYSTQRYAPHSDKSGQAIHFLLRRFIRVVPLYWLALLWTSKRLLISEGPSLDIVRDFLFIPHFHRVYLGGIFPLLVPGWTINYEVFFYGLFAISLLQGSLRYAFLPLALLTLVALWQLGVSPSSAPALFFTSSVLLEFLLGIAVYFAILNIQVKAPKALLWLVLVCSMGLLAVENSDDVRGFADGPFAALVVWSGIQLLQGKRIAWLYRLGDASYSIYLFHLASFSISGALLRHYRVTEPNPLNIFVVLTLHVVVAAGAGFLIHRVLERPFLGYMRKRLARSRFGQTKPLVAS